MSEALSVKTCPFANKALNAPNSYSPNPIHTPLGHIDPMMSFHNIILPAIWPTYDISRTTRVLCRGRFIAPIADLSALATYSAHQHKKVNSIIASYSRHLNTLPQRL